MTFRAALMHFALGAGLAINPANAGERDIQPWGDQGDGTYMNPILPGDFSDPDVIRVGADYYFITSTFQFSPGMAVLHSKDLVNWQFLGHCVDDISTIGPNLNWDQMNRYNRGIYAGSLRYHDGKFWMFMTTMDEGMFMTTAPNPAGPWAPLHKISDIKSTDDNCPFWDDDGQAWMVYSTPGAKWVTHLVKMSADGKSVDFSTDSILDDFHTSEGNKIYKFDKTYYVFHNEVRGGGNRVGVWMRAKNLKGPWEKKLFLQSAAGDRDREPNQGALVDTPDGKQWYFVTHQGRGGYYEGRPVSLLPVKWIDGWPTIDPSGQDGVGTVVRSPIQKPIDGGTPRSPQSSDDFESTELAPQWEWNYQPRAGKWSLTERPGFLRLHAFKPQQAGHFMKAGNTISQRVMGRNGGVVIAKIDIANMVDGQEAGVCHFSSAFRTYGVFQENGVRTIRSTSDLKMKDPQTKKAIPPEVDTGPVVTSDQIWFKFSIDSAGHSTPAFSTDGQTFTAFGEPYPLSWGNYRGDRVGVYTFNDHADDGYIDVDTFTYSYPAPQNKFSLPAGLE